MSTARDVVLIGVLIFVLATALFTTFFMSKAVFSSMLDVSQINNSAPARSVLVATDNLSSQFDYLVFALFIGLFLAMIVSSFLVGGNMIFAFIYFIIVSIGVVLSTVLNKVWVDLTYNAVFGNTIQSFPISNYIITHLPVFTAVAGMIGLIVMFAKPYIFTGGVEGYE